MKKQLTDELNARPSRTAYLSNARSGSDATPIKEANESINVMDERISHRHKVFTNIRNASRAQHLSETA